MQNESNVIEASKEQMAEGGVAEWFYNEKTTAKAAPGEDHKQQTEEKTLGPFSFDKVSLFNSAKPAFRVFVFIRIFEGNIFILYLMLLILRKIIVV